jgi:hypothetical protein
MTRPYLVDTRDKFLQTEGSYALLASSGPYKARASVARMCEVKRGETSRASANVAY